jgi:flavin reductase (DIM6/NTAB) family NADH-FMN oxidoreductase RutF
MRTGHGPEEEATRVPYLRWHHQEKEEVKQTTDTGKYYYCFPQTVAFVGVHRNIMPAAWHTPVSADPPLYGVLISPKRYTYELLVREKGFTICFLDVKNAHVSVQAGSTSGRTGDKLKALNLKHVQAEKVNGPILLDSYAAYECEKFDAKEYGDHFLFVGKIVLLHFQESVLHEDRLTDVTKVSPMLYFGKDRYITTDPNSLKIIKRS